MGQGNYQAILYGTILTEDEEKELFEKNLLVDLKPKLRTAYECNDLYLGYIITSGDPVMAREGNSEMIADVAMPLSALDAYIRKEFSAHIEAAEADWQRLQEHVGAQGFKLKDGELLFVADYD